MLTLPLTKGALSTVDTTKLKTLDDFLVPPVCGCGCAREREREKERERKRERVEREREREREWREREWREREWRECMESDSGA
jgi:hypothetical protein